MSGRLGGDDEDFAASAADGREEGLEGFEVGHAEEAPVAAEVDDPEEGVVCECGFVLLDGIGRAGGSHGVGG